MPASGSTYDTIGFTIASNPSDNEDGGFAGIADGVSADSSVTEALYLAGSASSAFQIITLKTSSEAPWTSLGSVTISFVPGSAPGDRWSIQSVQVVLSTSRGAPAPLMLVDQSAGVAVLTGGQPNVTLSLFDRCACSRKDVPQRSFFDEAVLRLRSPRPLPGPFVLGDS